MKTSTLPVKRGFVALAALALGFAGVAVTGTAATAHETSGACAPGEGVTVVVDFTDLGGEVKVGCAEGDPANGRAALEAAGFHPVDSQPGLICTIDEQPDPCPAEFTGSFWSYWHSTADGQWESYMVGADSSDPVQGELEGWRYSDGTTGPTLSPADASKQAEPEPTETAQNPGASDDQAESDANSSSQGDVLLYASIGFAVAVIVVIGLLILRSRKQKQNSSGA